MRSVEAAKCMWLSPGFSPKAFRFDDTFAHAKKRMLEGPVLIKRAQCKHEKTDGRAHTNTHFLVLLSS